MEDIMATVNQIINSIVKFVYDYIDLIKGFIETFQDAKKNEEETPVAGE